MKARYFASLLLLAAAGGRAAVAADQWVEVKSLHFTVLTNGSEKDGRKSLDQFERMRWVFQTLYSGVNLDPAVPILVVAAKDAKTFDGMEPAAYKAKGSLKLAGYFLHSADRNYILMDLSAGGEHPYTTVYHEYTHLQFAAADWMPLWLNEGTAEFMQNTDIRNKDVHLGQASPDDIAYLANHPMIPTRVLLAVNNQSPYYHDEQKGSVFYAESWALVHYFMITDRQRNLHRLNNYWELVRSHVDPVTAGEKAFGDLKQLDKELSEYVRQITYMEFLVNSAAAPIDESAYKVRAVPTTEMEARRADILVNVQRESEARPLLDSVLKADPANALARETMGYLAFRDGNLDEARKWYEEAVKLGSQDFLAYYYLAQFDISKGGGDSTEVESALHKAMELNPRFAASFDLLAGHYAMKRENLEEAHRLEATAIGLEPGNITFRINAANLLMEMNRYDAALTVLKIAAPLAKSPGEATMIQNRIQYIAMLRSPAKAVDPPQNAQDVSVVNAQGAKPEAQAVQREVAADPPKLAHPTLTATTPAHKFSGVIREVKCSVPYVIEFSVEGAAGKSVHVYNNNFTRIDLSVLGFDVKGPMNPCRDFEGMKAQVQYVVGEDKSVDGQVMAVQLRK